jgi:carbamoyltransferase
VAKDLADGRIVGWFQGRFEMGPRALGNRSILADPRRPEMRDVLNAKVKQREPFRPFAPAVLVERASEFFEIDQPDPFMTLAPRVRAESRDRIPAAVHVDGTGRIQTVERSSNPRYYGLIEAFGRLTGVPILLNTSFNRSEPIVASPADAIQCYLKSGMDVLVLGDFYTTDRPALANGHAVDRSAQPDPAREALSEPALTARTAPNEAHSS